MTDKTYCVSHECPKWVQCDRACRMNNPAYTDRRDEAITVSPLYMAGKCAVNE